MKSFVGIVVGVVLAFVIAACAAKAQKPTAPPPPGGPDRVGSVSPRTEIDQLDQAITDEMARLGEQRPEPAPNACVQGCEPQQMSTSVAAAAAQPPECTPGKSQTCTESCTLKESICKNATRICELAAQLGGGDAYANDKCNRGTSSCDAAKKRCCSCM